MLVSITFFSFALFKIEGQKSMQTYGSEKYGFMIQYPFNWEYDGFDMLSADQEYLGSFKPIFSSNLEDPYFSMAIIFLPIGSSYTLDEYAEKELQETKTHKVDGSSPFHKLISFDKNYTLGGKPAYKIVYQNLYLSSVDGKEINPQYMVVGTISDTIEYSLRFNANDPKQYNEYLPIAETMLKSFKWID
jgi:hypothetical protein